MPCSEKHVLLESWIEAALSSSQLMDQLQSSTLPHPERLELMRRCLAALALCEDHQRKFTEHIAAHGC